MTLNDGFDRTVSSWLDDQAGRGAPDYLDEVLTRTNRTRQRPAWSSLERWLPMDSTVRARVASVPRPGRIALVIALLIAFAGLVVFAVGSHLTRVPPPFGLARNGTLMSSHDGDIFAVDPVSGKQSPVITGSPFDFGATFSRDGSSSSSFEAHRRAVARQIVGSSSWSPTPTGRAFDS